MSPRLEDSDPAEEVERGPQLEVDAAGEETGTAAEGLPEVEGGVDADFAEEEGDDGDRVGGERGGEKLRAHGDEAAEVREGEVDRRSGHVVDDGFDGGEGGGEEGRVAVEEGEEVDAEGVEVEELLVDVGF